MNTLQLNVELYRTMSKIADDEKLMRKLLKYAKKLVATKQPDPTLMTKGEFYTMIERAEEEEENYQQGRTHRMLPEGSLDDFLKRMTNSVVIVWTLQNCSANLQNYSCRRNIFEKFFL